MSKQFSILDWQAFAPGIHDRAGWEAWAQAPSTLLGEDTPTLNEMPPLQRRRVDRLGRMALQVAYWCQGDTAVDVPQVFASRHGDGVRTLEMLLALARAEPFSPTQFGLSTHNAIAAQYGIARKLVSNSLTVAAGAATAEAAFVEALGLLAEGAAEVLVVVYDGHLPTVYKSYADEPDSDYAWACRVAPAQAGQRCYSLTVGPAGSTAAVRTLPHGLEVLQFLIVGTGMLEFQQSACCWRWCCHD